MNTANETEFDSVNMFGKGIPNDGYARYFSGRSFLKLLTEREKCPLSMMNVTFEPGCRNNWHIHHAKTGGGQILICTAGEGWCQIGTDAAQSLVPGTVVYIPANVRHWHGAKVDCWFSHISVEVPGTETSNEWLDEVSGEVYNKLK